MQCMIIPLLPEPVGDFFFFYRLYLIFVLTPLNRLLQTILLYLCNLFSILPAPALLQIITLSNFHTSEPKHLISMPFDTQPIVYVAMFKLSAKTLHVDRIRECMVNS